VDLRQQGHDLDGLQEVEEVVQPVHAVDQLLTIQATRGTHVIAPGNLPTQPFYQVLCDLIRLWSTLSL
jgi:hypothetical protein